MTKEQVIASFHEMSELDVVRMLTWSIERQQEKIRFAKENGLDTKTHHKLLKDYEEKLSAWH